MTISETHHTDPTVTFANDLALTKGAIGDELFYGVPEINTREFDD